MNARHIALGNVQFTVTFDADGVADTIHRNGKVINSAHKDAQRILRNANAIRDGKLPEGFTPGTDMRPAPEPRYHYFASNAFGWGTGATRAEAIRKASQSVGADLIARNVKANGGLYTWSCRVDAPPSTDYWIQDYAPEQIRIDGKRTGVMVPISEAREHRVQNIKGHVLARD